MSGGFGGGGWGAVPWGGSALEFENPPSDFDIFCFFDSPTSMGSIFSSIDVNIISNSSGLGLQIDGNNDLVVASGGTADPVVAAFEVTTVSSSDRTLEFTLTIDDLPADFSDLPNSHIFVGTTTAASSCAGLFFSAAGIGYVGGVHYTPTLVLDSTFQLIPGSNAYVSAGTKTVVRVAINDTTGSVYLYVTPVATLSLTGHILRAILPVIQADTLAFPTINRVMVSGCGAVLAPTTFRLDELCMSSSVLVANLAPIADAGIDRSVELCSIIKLDGIASYDPEGAALLYRWRLIEAPPTSSYSIAGSDGRTYPVDLSGFTDKFYSPDIGALLDPVLVGDVLLIGSEVRSVTAVGVEVSGPYIGQYFMQFAVSSIPDNLTGVQFKVLRQRGIYTADQVVATFLPDVVGFYRFDLIVSDGSLPSAAAVVVINVLEAILPRGVVPDISFVFGLMSDFWGLVEDTERITTMWSGIAQVAAGELLSLWQHDYAKSLRDIQRQFTRKWLHYDLLLPEPIPELTKVRQVSSGLYSTYFGSWASYAYGGGSLTVQVAGQSAPTVLMFSSGATTVADASVLVADLQFRLRQIDSRFSVKTVTTTLSEVCLQVVAPFAFSITASTMPQHLGVDVFVVGVASQEPNGHSSGNNELTHSGAGVGANTYRVNTDLSAFNIVENDLLCLDGTAYRIIKASSYGTITDILTKEPLPTSPPATWRISSYVTSQLLDFWNGLVFEGDAAYLEIAQSNAEAPSSALYYNLYQTVVTGLCEALPSTLPVDLSELPADSAAIDHSVLLAKVLRRQYCPISPLVMDVPTVSAKIVIETQTDEESVLRRNVDYFIESVRGGSAIRFVSGQGGGPDVWEGANPPDRLWAEFTYLDNRPTIEQNFGIPVEFTLDDLETLQVELDYLSAVRGLWYAYFNGPTLYNLRVGAQILLGLPFAEEAGTIIEIRTDFSPTLGRLLVQDSANTALVRSYTFPKVLALETNPSTQNTYVVGDTVTQFAPMVTGAAVTDYIKDPRWMEGLINQQYLREVDKYFHFLVSVDSAAFNLSAFLAVRDFILKVKPTYTYPLVAVQSGNTRSDEITVDDTVVQNVTVNLYDTTCGGLFGSSSRFDHYRGDGSIYNQFDADADPGTAAPTFPTSDVPVLWAFDKEWLCPEDSVVAEVSSKFPAAAAITVGQCFVVGEPYTSVYKFLKAGPFAVGPQGSPVTIPVDPNDVAVGTVQTAGTLTKVKVRTQGGMNLATYNKYGTVGGIVVVAGALLVDGDTFTLSAASAIAKTFEFDSDGVVGSGNIPVPFTTSDSASNVRDSVIRAINNGRRLVGDPSVYSPNVTATAGGINVVICTPAILTDVSAYDNIAITETVADAGFFVLSITGAEYGAAYVLEMSVNGVAVSGTAGVFQMTDPNGSMEFTVPGFPKTVAPGDVISAKIWTHSTVSSRTPPWAFFEVTVYHSDLGPWYIGQVLPQGTYRTVRPLT